MPSSNAALVDALRNDGVLVSESVEAAFRRVDRKWTIQADGLNG